MKKILLALGAGGVTLALIPMFAAFEAHVVNVTARIENALNVPIKSIDFGTVFPQEKQDKTFDVQLSGSFMDQAGGTSNLTCNGSFEVPEVTDPAKWQLFPNGYAGLCWTVEWATAVNTYQNQARPDPALAEYHEDVVAGWVAQDGDQYAELDSDWFGPNNPLNGEPALTKISQYVTTVPGQQYTLSYYFSPRPSTGSSDNEMSVQVDGSEVQHIGPVAGGSGTSWSLYNNVFTATLNSTKIEFISMGLNNSLGVFLDNVTVVGNGRVTAVSYLIRQKPKCGLPNPQTNPNDPVSYSDFGVVTENTDGTFKCVDADYVMLPLLCPYLSKHEISGDGDNTENDGPGIAAFHGLPGIWDLAKAKSFDTQVWGILTAAGHDILDTWNIDLKVPCFGGYCAQDWAQFVDDNDGTNQANPNDYTQPIGNEHQIFGCDLWLEVTNISNGLLTNGTTH